MKKCSIWLLAVLIALSLCACQRTAETDETTLEYESFGSVSVTQEASSSSERFTVTETTAAETLAETAASTAVITTSPQTQKT